MKLDIWVDGACSGNPGPGGWGFYTSEQFKLSGGVDQTTNNEMELVAILRSLEYIAPRPELEITIYSDSFWSISVIKGDWMAKTHLGLISNIRQLIDRRVGQLSLVWIRGHDNIRGNEIADALAKYEAKRRR